MLVGKATVAACAAALVVGIAGCGSSSKKSGGSGVTAAAYDKAVCDAVGPYEKSVSAKSNALNLSSIKSAADGKTALVDFMKGIVTDTDKAVDQLKAAGTPDVKNGKTIASAIVTAFNELDTELKSAETQSESLPTASADAFKTAADALGKSVSTSLDGIGSSLNGLKSAELETAAKSIPSCQTLS